MSTGGRSGPDEASHIDLDDPAAALELHLARLEAILDTLHEGLVVLAPDGRLERMNAAARAWLGQMAEPMQAGPDRWLTHLRMGRVSGLEETSEAIVARVLAGEAVDDLQLHISVGGPNRTLQVNGAPLPAEAGGGAVFTVRDVTVEVESTDALRREARRDPLTDLPNRRAFDEAVVGAGTSDVVVLIDLDQFKPVNDQHGHQVGDLVLLTLGARLRVVIRAGDLAARVGGDEFGVLLRRVHDEEVTELAERLRSIIERPIEAEGVLIKVGASVGSTRVRAGEDPRDTMRRVDDAMYADKRRRHDD